MTKSSSEWRRKVFTFSMVACVQFVFLTLLAMLLYAGGTNADAGAVGYSFWRNFFSDLGLTVSHSGASNTPSMLLFATALTIAGLGLIGYFVAAPYFFWRSPAGKALSSLGSFFGVLSGLGYIGVAFTPANLLLRAHMLSVYTAFGAFFVAVIFYAVTLFMHRTYPRRLGAVFVIFGVLLGAYLWLLFLGPGGEGALIVQVAGQKVISYAAIITIFVQSQGARQRLATEHVVSAVTYA